MEDFKANRKSPTRQNQQVTLKPEDIFGLFKVTSFIAITMNLEFNSVCPTEAATTAPAMAAAGTATERQRFYDCGAYNSGGYNNGCDGNCQYWHVQGTFLIGCVRRDSQQSQAHPFWLHTGRSTRECILHRRSTQSYNLSTNVHCTYNESIPCHTIPEVTRSTHTDLYVMQEKRIDDYWNVDPNRTLSDSWKGFTKFTFVKEKLPKGYAWSGRRLTTNSSSDH